MMTLDRVEQMTHVGHWSVNVIDGSFFHSDEIKRIFGYDPLEYALSVEDAINAYHPDDRDEVIRLFNKAVETGENYEFDLRVIQPSGDIRYVHSKGYTEKNKAGKVIRVYGVFQDITESKKALMLLNQSKMLLKASLESQNDMILLSIGPDYCYLYFNKIHSDIMKAVYGVNIKIGMNILDCITVDADRAAAKENYDRALRGESHTNIRTYGDTTSATFESFFNPIKNEKNEIIGATAMARDISERLKNEKELQKAQKLESLGLFAGGIAHDFNNLLTVIYGNLDIIEGTPEDAESLKECRMTINRARGITSQLLTFAKGGKPVKKRGNLIQYLQRSVKFVMSGAKASVAFNIDKDLWSLEYDEGQLGQAFDNITINAIHSMAGGGKLKISAHNTTLNPDEYPDHVVRNYVEISFKDGGTGIPPDKLPHIFDPYYTTKDTGRGLGLASTYSIIKNHGGWIDVQSKLGKGSTFTIFLPALEHRADETKIQNESIRKGTGKILIMDDDDSLRLVLLKSLKSLGYTAVGVANGHEVLSILKSKEHKNNPFNALILDLTVPGSMGGEETVIEIRKFEPKLPVFVASGYSENSVMAEPTKFGFTGSLIKPFSIKTLAELLDNFLKKS
jgi:PAS domain S-box-containing protein